MISVNNKPELGDNMDEKGRRFADDKKIINFKDPDQNTEVEANAKHEQDKRLKDKNAKKLKRLLKKQKRKELRARKKFPDEDEIEEEIPAQEAPQEEPEEQDVPDEHPEEESSEDEEPVAEKYFLALDSSKKPGRKFRSGCQEKKRFPAARIEKKQSQKWR